MKVSELTAALQKVQQVAGDVDVVLKDVEGGAETDLLSLGVHIGTSPDDQASRVELEHGTAQQPLPVDPEPAAPPAE